MAKLSAHGSIVGTVEYIRYSKRYMSDGVTLKNYGDGWKIAGKVKPGITPEAAFNNAKAKHDEKLAQRSALAAYRDFLFSLASLNKRARLHLMVEMMPSDPDGVWSEACDGYGDNVDADISDICRLCDLYNDMQTESADIKALNTETV